MPKSQQRTGHRLLTIGATTAVAASTMLVATALPAYAATATLSQTQVAVGGGTVLRIMGTGLAISDTHGVRFAPAAGACPSDYDETTPAGAVSAGAMDAFGTSMAVIVTPAGLTAGAAYKVCVYADTSGSGALVATDTIPDVTAVHMLAQNTTVLKAGDKVTLTANSGIFSAATYASQIVNNTTTTCPLTLQTPAAPGPPAYITAPATTKTTGSSSQIAVTMPAATAFVAGTPYLVCTYATATAGAALVARSRSTVSTVPADLPAPTLSPTGGSSATATTITQTLPNTSTLFTTTPDVLITQNACASTRPAALGGDYVQGGVTKIANYKIAVTVPSSVAVSTGDVTTPWNLCTYASTTPGTALVLVPTIYNVAPVLSLDTAAYAVGSAAADTSAEGPAQGNSLVTISGLTGIPTAEGAVLSASLGGSPLAITGKTSTSITGTTSAHAAGAVNLTVTTAAGTKSTTTTPYTFTYGITVAPNTAASGTTPIIDITGAGFGALTFGDGGAALVANRAYVFLTDNVWNAQDFSSPLSAFATVPISYCNNVLPISDTEIICTLNLTSRIDSVSTWTPTVSGIDVPPGSYTVTVANARGGLDETLYNYSIVSSGSTFTVASY
jgi:IPT/TIG domain-containing protein